MHSRVLCMVPLEQEAEHALQADHSFQDPSTGGRQRSRYQGRVTGSAGTRHPQETGHSHIKYLVIFPSSMTVCASRVYLTLFFFVHHFVPQKVNLRSERLICFVQAGSNAVLKTSKRAFLMTETYMRGTNCWSQESTSASK